MNASRQKELLCTEHIYKGALLLAIRLLCVFKIRLENMFNMFRVGKGFRLDHKKKKKNYAVSE